MIIEVNGVPLHVEDHGKGTPVLLIHSWPDSAHLWRHRYCAATRGTTRSSPSSWPTFRQPCTTSNPGCD